VNRFCHVTSAACLSWFRLIYSVSETWQNKQQLKQALRGIVKDTIPMLSIAMKRPSLFFQKCLNWAASFLISYLWFFSFADQMFWRRCAYRLSKATPCSRLNRTSKLSLTQWLWATREQYYGNKASLLLSKEFQEGTWIEGFGVRANTLLLSEQTALYNAKAFEINSDNDIVTESTTYSRNN